MATVSGPRSVMEKIAAKDLVIHPVAQRKLVQSKLRELKESFNLDSVGVVHAVRYMHNGKITTLVVDGQHRIVSLVALELGDWMVDVMVHLDVKDDRGACALFLELNRRASVSPFDTFEKELMAGAPDAVGAMKILTYLKLGIARSVRDSHICSVSSLLRVYRIDGGKTLNNTLAVISTAWGPRASALEGKIIEGLALVISRYKAVLDPSITAKLAKYKGGPNALLGNARSISEMHRVSLVRGVAQAVIGAYNQGRRSGRLDLL